jgi:CHAD domain-containing protein
MQDVLGALNDLVVAHRLLDELENASRHAAITLVRSSLEDERAESAAAFDKAWKRFAARAPFWVKASD